MKFNTHIAITLISVLCLQVFILCILLLIKKHNKQASILLALVLVFFGLIVGNLVLYYALALGELKDYIPYVTIEPLFGIGPSLYLYTKSVTDPDYKIHKWEYFHFLPVLLELIYYRTSFYRMGAIDLLYKPQNFNNVFFMFEQWMGFLSATIYMIFAVKLLLDYRKWVSHNFSSFHNRTLQWLNKPIVAFVSFWCLWFIIRLGDMFLYSGAYRDFYYFPMYIVLSAITLWIGFLGYFRTQIDAIGFSKKERLKNNPSDTTNNYSAIIYKLKELLECEKLFLDPDLDMISFSSKVGVPSTLISKAINSELKMNFHEFVNQYRVNEFKNRIKKLDNKNLTLLGHAFDSGFASKSTFNHIFKKYTQLTPKQYYQKIHGKVLDNKSENMILDD